MHLFQFCQIVMVSTVVLSTLKELCFFVGIQQTGGNLPTGRKSTALCQSALKDDCRNFPFLVLIGMISFLGIMCRDKKHSFFGIWPKSTLHLPFQAVVTEVVLLLLCFGQQNVFIAT